MATTLTEDITGVFTVGNFDDLGTRLLAIQKQIEKSLITNVHAPHILSKRDGIKTKSEEAISKVAKEGKLAIKGINDTLDTAIKGQWSTSVREAVTTASNKYDKI